MVVENNVLISKNNNISNQSINNQRNNHYVNPNGVDKTPQNDTFQLSTTKKVGIGAAILATIIGGFFLLRGKKLPKNVANTVKEVAQETKPKMQMTEEAKKVYENVDKDLHKINTTTAQTIEKNLASKAKQGSWDSKDMKEFYTQLEKESDAKILTEKLAKDAEIKALKEVEIFESELSGKSPRELSQLKFDLTWDEIVTKLEKQAVEKGWNQWAEEQDIGAYLSPTEKIEYNSIKNKLKLVNEQIMENENKLAHLRPKTFIGSDVPMHHELNGKNTSIRDALELKEQQMKGKILEPDEQDFVDKMTKYMDKADASFEALEPLEKRCVGYRGRTENPIIKRYNRDFDIVDAAKTGDIIVPDTGYSYAGFKRSLADTWGGPGAGGTNMEGKPLRQIMYTMYYPEGAKVSRNLEHGGEIVAPRGSSYRVLSKEVDELGNVEIAMEYILPKAK